MQNLRPDYYVSDYSIITSEWLLNHNIHFVFSDLDSTLVRHGETGEEDLSAWITKLKRDGITLIGTTNKNKKRAKQFKNRHGIEVVDCCNKPSIKVLRNFFHKHHISGENVLFMGDQLIIDIMCGNRLKAETILVYPIKEKSPLIIKLSWLVDNLIMKILHLR